MRKARRPSSGESTSSSEDVGSGGSSSESNHGSTRTDSNVSSGTRSSGTRSSSNSGSESSRTKDSPRESVPGYESERSGVTTASSRGTGGSSRKGRSSGSMSSTSSSDDSSEGAAPNTLKSRMKALFKKQDAEVTTTVEKMGELHDRVDASLLTKVQEYEAAPSEAASYGAKSFWDERYANDEEVVEWYHPWDNLAPTLTQYMDEQDEVLVCGCGNSEMSVDMYDDGFQNVTNADISRVAIHQMTETYKAYPMEWKSVDLTREEFAEEKFDVALDKACLDSITCSHNGGARAAGYLQQMDRILQPEGAYICVSFAPPEDRLELLENWDLDKPETSLAWNVHVDAIAKPELKPGRVNRGHNNVYYIYVCIKDPAKTEQKKLAKERVKREQEKKLAKMLGFKGRGRGRGRSAGRGKR